MLRVVHGRTSRTGVPYDALKLTLSCRTKNISRMPCDPGAGIEVCVGNDGVDAARFIGDPRCDGSGFSEEESLGVTRTRPEKGAPRAATSCLRSANDEDVTSRVNVDAICGGVSGMTVASCVSAALEGEDWRAISSVFF